MITVWGKVNKNTRAPDSGKLIMAPCGDIVRVYHFSWYALACQHCGEDHQKLDYVTETKGKE